MNRRYPFKRTKKLTPKRCNCHKILPLESLAAFFCFPFFSLSGIERSLERENMMTKLVYLVFLIGIAQHSLNVEAFTPSSLGLSNLPKAIPSESSPSLMRAASTSEEETIGRDRQKREIADALPIISVGEAIPNMDIEVVKPKTDGTMDSKALGIVDLLGSNGTSIIVGMPGAFTPTCTKTHFPGYLKAAKEFSSLGVDNIAVLTTNDKFVYNAWASSMGMAEDIDDAEGAAAKEGPSITMISDGDGDFVKKVGLAEDMGFGLGTRSKRFAMVIKDGKVDYVATDPGMDECTATSAEMIISVMRRSLTAKATAVVDGDNTDSAFIAVAAICLAIAAFSGDLLDSDVMQSSGISQLFN